MSPPKETVWEAEPHTLAKHRILRRYLQGWMPIILQSRHFPGLIYFEGFCGPGVYSGGEPGSPIVALEVAKEMTGRHKDSLFLFADKHKGRVGILEQEINKLGELPGCVTTKARVKTFESAAPLVVKMRQSRWKRYPTFTMIDPFGFAGIPLDLIRSLMEQPSSECFITFMADSLNRWLDDPREPIAEEVTKACGTEEAASIVLSKGGSRVDALRDLYLEQLKSFSEYCRYFEIRDRDNRVLYYLFFISNNPLGMLKMKEAMWSVAPTGSFCFSDSTDPTQQILFDDADCWLPVAKSEIMKRFEGQKLVPAETVKAFIKGHPIFLERHATAALKELEVEKRIVPNPLKRNGRKRSKRTFPPGALIDFQ